jgi:hypothetical protein
MTPQITSRARSARVLAILAGAAAFTGCNQRAAPPPPERPATTGADYALPAFVGKVWMSTTRGKPLGSIMIFLPDKTLLMDSCFETFRIAEWGVISEDTIRWREDAIPIEAQYVQPTEDSLQLKIAGMSDDQTYMSASVPYVCPDMPK